MNHRRALLLAAATSLLAPSAWAQEGKVWRIGMLETTSRTLNAANLDALLKGLHELGYAEGKNMIIHYRSADGNPERFRELAKELVQERVDLIVTRGTPSTRAAMAATSTIPIVAAQVGAPVSSGLVKSLAHPGGNVTGLSALTPDSSPKRIQLLKEVIPRVTRVGFFANMSNPNNQLTWRELDKAARSVGIQAQVLDVRSTDDFRPAFEAARKERLGALVIATDTLTQTNRKTILELAVADRLPTISANSEFVTAGALMSYGPSTSKRYYQASRYVDKILKGAKPADLPMEEASSLELVLNFKTAKTLGIKFPQSVEFRADKLIE